MRRRYMESSGNIDLDSARMRVHQLKRFYIHLFIYVIAVIIFVSNRYLDLPFNFWPFHFINEFFMWIWTIIIAIKAVKLFLKEQFLGTRWEQRKIKEMMDEEKAETKKWN